MSCLFDSLSYFLKIPSIEIRHIICDYLENNGQLMEDIDTTLLLSFESKKYIKKMRNPNTWGGAIEIKTASNIWNLKIKVKNLRQKENKKTTIKFIPLKGVNSDTKKIKITWNGYHYEPIVEKKTIL